MRIIKCSPLGLRTELRVLRPPLFLFLVLIVLIGTVFRREMYAAIAVPISASPAVADIMMTFKSEHNLSLGDYDNGIRS